MMGTEKTAEVIADPVIDTRTGFADKSQERKSFLDTLKGHGRDPDELGRHLLEQALQYDEAQLERDAVRVRRKLDFILLPMMCVTYMFSFLDKQTLNYANAYGLQQDTHMDVKTGHDYQWTANALNFGWLVAAYPWNLALQRYPIGRTVSCMLFVWGTLCMLQAAVFNFSGFFAVRFFIGAVEACISPASILLTSMFWTAEEQSLRSSFWLACNGFASIIGALLAYGSGHVVGLAIPNWKLIFLIVGAITFCWGFVLLIWFPDGPHNAKFLSDYEKIVAVWRVSKNRMGIKNDRFKLEQVWEAFLDPKVWLIWLSGIAVGILNGGVVNFASTLIKSFGFSGVQASLMQTPGGAFEVVGVIMFGFLSSFKNLLTTTIILACIPGMGGLIGLLSLKHTAQHKYNLLGCAWVQSFVGSPIILIWGLPGVNVAGHTKRSTALGVFFVMYSVGNIVSPHMFLGTEAKAGYPTAIKGLLGSYAATIVFAAMYGVLSWTSNATRNRKGEHAGLAVEGLEGFDDMTDKVNKHFRYRL